ncbi:PQQ-dependent sugar dehydrogenase, partial [Listeria monocytogenes]|uniref:PQQ-dependent sugar dehydrogenase n=1 Tax=Listeria monocytogenes TaxID=1639 RepID=UPI0014953303
MRRIYYTLFSLVLLAPLLPGPDAAAQSLATRQVISKLDIPWEIIWGPDNWIWMTEMGGRVSRVNPETGEQKLLLQVPGIYAIHEAGLHGMALHPNFADT